MVRKIFYKVTGLISKLELKIKGAFLEDKIEINGLLMLRGNIKGLSIGEGCVINTGKGNIPVGFPQRTSFWLLDNGRIDIGKNCGISHATFCCMKHICLGNHVLIGSGVKIYDTDFHSINYKNRRDIMLDKDRKSECVVLGNDVFVGAGTIILKGCSIGNRAVIGAGSVVTCDIPQDQVWAGNPARFIKELNR